MLQSQAAAIFVRDGSIYSAGQIRLFSYRVIAEATVVKDEECTHTENAGAEQRQRMIVQTV